jgi:tetratricopeptide (TPR) repeat protein
MSCPGCGRETSASQERCPACGTILTATLGTGAFTAISDSIAQASAAATGSFPVTGNLDAVTQGEHTRAVAQTRSPGADSGALDWKGPLQPGEAFGSRYHIIRLLGMGGMGAVYQAWDSELGVAVAIKVVLPGVASDPEAAADVERRFKRELLLARQVTHKNVVRIHDLGEIDGIKYITMSYVEGSDLASILRQQGALPVARALAIARAVASGLAAAHAEGVVHRDLKPANIMIEKNDDALIMDFGIARSTGRGVAERLSGISAPPGSLPGGQALNRTMVGTVVGTLEYMAPEQAKGQAVDQRADIYSFGLIVYDMLVGRSRAQRSTSAIAELQARMSQPPPSVKASVPEVPDPLDRLISQCLDPDRDKRFATTVDLVAALNKLDDKGGLIPIARRITRWGVAATAALVVVLLGVTYFVTRRAVEPVQAHDPVSVLIADFQNGTNDPSFDGTLEPTLRRGLEDAGFVTAYDRGRIRPTFGVAPPDVLNEANAREFAVRQGLGVVVSGSIESRGSGYDVGVKAVQAVTGDELVNTRSRASSKDEVLAVATRLVTTVRRALGDETSDSAQIFAMRSISAASLEVVRYYAVALEAQSDGKYEQAREAALKAVELDPTFGMGYSLLGGMSRNLGNLQDAEKYGNQALSYLGGMTERERFATRGFYYRVTGDHQQCVKEYGEMTARYPADVGAHNQRALCLSKLRDMRESVDEIRQAVQILPKRVLFRSNLAVYAAYAGDFQTAEKEARAIPEPNDLAMLAIAFAQLGQGLLTEASGTFDQVKSTSPRGASWAASGLAHMALYEGRFSDAARLFEQGAAADLASKNSDRAARKLTSLAFTELSRGRTAPAIAAAERALQSSNAMEVRFLAARVFIQAGAVDKARPLAAELSSALPAEPQAYGKILEGAIALKNGDSRQAIKILGDANSVLDTWIGHFDLGQAFLKEGALPQADSEFDRCIQRRGEALALLVDEEPTYGYFPTAYYYQGLVRQGLKNASFADSYREYLNIRGKSTEDPLLPDVRKRASQ